MKILTAQYQQAAEYVDTAFVHPVPAWASAKRWLSRVGRPRLISERLVAQARWALRDVNANLLRSDPELLAKLYAARQAVQELDEALARDHWRRFEG